MKSDAKTGVKSGANGTRSGALRVTKLMGVSASPSEVATDLLAANPAATASVGTGAGFVSGGGGADRTGGGHFGRFNLGSTRGSTRGTLISVLQKFSPNFVDINHIIRYLIM